MPAKRVNVVSVKLVRNSSFLLEKRNISCPRDLYNIIKPFLEDIDRETLLLICVDTKNQPTCISTVSIGSLNSSQVHPREVFKVAILSNAYAIFIAHNHPSGDTTPSREDINLTLRLKECGEILGIKLLDHIIIGDNNYCSLQNRSIL